eukprot:756074-Hanusia_phi.AAC.1
MTESSMRERLSSGANIKQQCQPASQPVKPAPASLKNMKKAPEQPVQGENKVLMTLLEVRKRFHAKTAGANATKAGGLPAQPDASIKGVESPGKPQPAMQADNDCQEELNWEKEDCIVCSESLQSKVVGKIDCHSSHVFCFDCIFKWGATCESSCPLCKQVRLRARDFNSDTTRRNSPRSTSSSLPPRSQRLAGGLGPGTSCCCARVEVG